MDLISLEVRVMDSVRLDQTIVATVDAQWKLRFMGHAIDERVLLTDVWVNSDEWLAGGSPPLEPGPGRGQYRMMVWLAALLIALAPLPAAPAPPPADTLAGTYATQQMEVGAKLELKADGRFRYMLDYGAVSEAAEGDWTAAKGVVHLDSDPMEMQLLTEIERTDAAFRDEQLAIDAGALVMQRHDTIFIFYRDEP